MEPSIRAGRIDLWDDSRLLAGTDWRIEIRQALASARVAVLLVSGNFLASEFIATDELPPLLKNAKSAGTVILPVIVTPCLFEETKDLSQFQAINSPSRPLASMSKTDREEIFVKLIRRIENILNADKIVTAAEKIDPSPPQSLEDSITRRIKLEDKIKSTDPDDLLFEEIELNLSDTWDTFVSRQLEPKFDSIQYIKEDPDRESSFYCSGKPGALSYDLIVSGRKRGIPITRHIDIIRDWLHPLAIEAAGQDAGTPWDTSLFPIKDESGKEKIINRPQTSCRDGVYWVLFIKLRET
jgi:TIR domain